MKPSERKCFCRTVVFLAALIQLAVNPVMAQVVIQQGIDAFETTGGTSTKIDLPPGFFCPKSPPVSAVVELTGKPLATNPPGILGRANTVVERLKDADLRDEKCAVVPIVVRALKLVSSKSLEVPCGKHPTKWSVSACTDCCCGNVQPITEIEICLEDRDCGCGRFHGELRINVCLKFTNVDDGTVLGPIQQPVILGAAMPWCEKNPGAVVEARHPFMVDTDCDAQADLAVPCTTNFFPGATCGGPGCPPPVCHEGPAPDHEHCVRPGCERQ